MQMEDCPYKFCFIGQTICSFGYLNALKIWEAGKECSSGNKNQTMHGVGRDDVQSPPSSPRQCYGGLKG